MIFWLGCHMPHWLATRGVPLFVSRSRLAGRVTMPRAVAPWALDSGGFSEIATHSRWTIDEVQYIADVRRYRDEIGGLAWAAPMDWMCEPIMIAKSGLTVIEHQRRTVMNYLELRRLAPDLPIIPVLQGIDRGPMAAFGRITGRNRCRHRQRLDRATRRARRRERVRITYRLAAPTRRTGCLATVTDADPGTFTPATAAGF